LQALARISDMNSSVGILLADGILNYIKSLKSKGRSELRFYKQTINLVLAKSTRIASIEYSKGNVTERVMFSFKQKILRESEEQL
jgi:hypothetical protein